MISLELTKMKSDLQCLEAEHHYKMHGKMKPLSPTIMIISRETLEYLVKQFVSE